MPVTAHRYRHRNFFLHEAIRDHPKGRAAVTPLVDHVIPACHESGTQGRRHGGVDMGRDADPPVSLVIYLNWGLTPHDLQHMPPSLIRGFSRDALPKPSVAGQPSASAKRPIYVGMGKAMGDVVDGDRTVAAGQMLMRGSWNAALYGPLLDTFTEQSSKPDVIIHKVRA